MSTMLGLSCAAAVMVGAWHYRPPRINAWFMLAGALVIHTVTRLVFAILPGPANARVGAGIAVIYLLIGAMVILLITAMLRLAPLRGGWHPIMTIDAAILVLGTALLSWLILGLPWSPNPAISTGREFARTIYLVRDLLILAVVAQFFTTLKANVSVVLLGAGAVSLATYDVLYRVAYPETGWLSGEPLEFFILFFYLAIGAAALLPSMATFTERPHAVVVAGPVRLAFLAGSALVPFVLLLAVSERGRAGQSAVIAVAAMIMLLLVLARLVVAAIHLRRQYAGERTLREAVAELVQATDIDAVDRALSTAVRGLLPPRTVFSLELKIAGDHHQPAPTPSTGTDEDALVIPLTLTNRPGGDTRIGSLIFTGAGPALSHIRAQLDVLAAQATLVLERVRLDAEIIRHSSEKYFRTLVQNTADVILIVDDDDKIRYASPSAASLFGIMRLTNMSLPALLDDSDRYAARDLLNQVRTTTPKVPTSSKEPPVDWTVNDHAGHTARVTVTCRNLRDDPSIRGLVVTLRDVTEKRRLEHKLVEQAFHDALTGLANRTLFSERVSMAVARASANGTLAGVLFIDLDDFKVVNDGLGHEIGDALLRQTALVVRQALPSTGTAARLGGDEFAAVVEDVTDVALLDEIAGHIVSRLRDPVEIEGHLLVSGASVGVATTDDAYSAQELLRCADLALYAAKETGKNGWRHFESWMQRAIVDRMELRSSLDRALVDGELLLEYQPIIELTTGRPVGCEALLRWQHPVRGRLLPNQFIDVAEDSGLIVPIGEWVITTAIATAQHWRALLSHESPYLSMNVSGKQFRSRGFTDTLCRLVDQSGLDEGTLMLEITESLLLKEDEDVWFDLQRLRQHGIRIAIDDFGTGYSALSYLHQRPIDVVKLDRLFTSDMTSSAQQYKLVEGIVGLSQALGLEVVAEGIESEAERSLVQHVGCGYGQGYFFSAPMDEEQALRWVAERTHAAIVTQAAARPWTSPADR